ncbi:MAG: serine/threonine protein kinase [Prevotellaceae bacterium]|nr:serine/threonine protein kinase [Prevotellaceae bacterium]
MSESVTNGLPAGAVLQGKTYQYSIVKVLGQGSFGITYLATVKMPGELGALDVNVAVKEFFMSRLNTRADDRTTVEATQSPLVGRYRERFRREAAHLARLRHQSIVKALEVFDQNNTTYFVMEYVDGQSLDEHIQERGKLTEAEALPLFRNVVRAISYMHKERMLHLDLKPANIMLRRDGSVQIVDFGLSKQFSDDGAPETSTTIGLGTPGYAPLEQADYRSEGFPATLDIYALGATLFKMLCGVTPPNASAVLDDGLPTETLERAHVSGDVVALLTKAMEPMRKRRYQSAEELLRALEGCRHTADGDRQEDSEEEDFEGISVCALLADGSVTVFHMGREYHVPANAPSDVRVEACAVASCKLSDFLGRNRRILRAGWCFFTYHTAWEYCLVNKLVRTKFPDGIRRYSLHREINWIAYGWGRAEHWGIEYRGWACRYTIEQGLFEVAYSGRYFRIPDGVWPRRLSQTDALRSLYNATRIKLPIFRGDTLTAPVFLDAFPFRVALQTQWTIQTGSEDTALCAKGSYLPFKKAVDISVRRDEYGEGESFLFFVGNIGYPLDISERLGYVPERVEVIVDIDEGGKMTISLRDKGFNKEVRLSLQDLTASAPAHLSPKDRFTD